MEIVSVDIGSTHERFALAKVGAVASSLGDPETMQTAKHASLQMAWNAFPAISGG